MSYFTKFFQVCYFAQFSSEKMLICKLFFQNGLFCKFCFLSKVWFLNCATLLKCAIFAKIGLHEVCLKFYKNSLKWALYPRSHQYVILIVSSDEVIGMLTKRHESAKQQQKVAMLMKTRVKRPPVFVFILFSAKMWVPA